MSKPNSIKFAENTIDFMGPIKSIEKPIEPDTIKKAIKTLHFRIKDKHAKFLLEQSREVNFVWNYCNETSSKMIERDHKFCSRYDLDKLTSGVTKGEDHLTIHSQTVQSITEEYVTRRNQFNKRKLRWRVSNGAKRSLGWIPFKKAAIKFRNGQVWYQGKALSLWESPRLSQYDQEDLGPGNFAEDNRGRWYFNITVKEEIKKSTVTNSIGIDLGLKDCVVCSDGQVLTGRNYRKLEDKLAMAQRANKKKLVKNIHHKIKNKRKDELHKLSTNLVNNYKNIFVGNVSSEKLIKTNMAKSTLDAGWGMFRQFLKYKSYKAGVVYKEINEKSSTQICSSCLKVTGPKGLKDLRIREWTCGVCNTKHGRDTNAAKNILRMGLHTLV